MFKQKFGLRMGLPLSGIFTCLFLKFFEFEPFKYILLKEIHTYNLLSQLLCDKYDFVLITTYSTLGTLIILLCTVTFRFNEICP